MNLFVVGWDLDPEARARSLAALRSMTEAFPLLDAATVGSAETDRAFAAWIHWPMQALGPRRYVHREDEDIVLFDGVAADGEAHVAGHDAASWAAHWGEVGERLEGHYLGARIGRDPEALEVVTDPLGLHPAFAHRDGRRWWVSNSVSLLARATGSGTLDLEGMSGLLVRFQPGGERTLVEGISSLRPGERWRWEGDGEPRRTSHFSMADLARAPRRSFGTLEAAELAGAIGGPLRSLSDVFAPLMCPITSGRDTRMIVAVMMALGLPGDYFTAGDPEGADARHGSAIARRFGLPHRLTGDDHEGLMAHWDEVSRRSLLQTDGFVTLAHARNAYGAPERLTFAHVQLYGAGGEIARATSQPERFVLGRPTVEEATAEALRKVDRRGPLLREATRQRVYDHVAERMRDLHAQGFAPVDLPMALAVTEGNRRWSGAQARQIADRSDVFMPIYVRAYVKAAFATPPVERLMERVPFALVGHLSPALRAMPTQAPWPPQWLGGLLVSRAVARQRSRAEHLIRRFRRRVRLSAGRKRERLQLLEAVLPLWRERFLDRADSQLWELVDRDAFEALTVPSSTPRKHAANGPTLFQVGTALAYEEALRAWVGWQPSVAVRGSALTVAEFTPAAASPR